jgi:hypothetical protein
MRDSITEIAKNINPIVNLMMPITLNVYAKII